MKRKRLFRAASPWRTSSLERRPRRKEDLFALSQVRGLSCLTEQVLGAVHQARVLASSTCPLWTARDLGTFALNVCADLGASSK